MFAQGAGNRRAPWWRRQITAEAFRRPFLKNKRTSNLFQMKLKYLTPLAVLAFVAPALRITQPSSKINAIKPATVSVSRRCRHESHALDLISGGALTGLEDGIPAQNRA